MDKTTKLALRCIIPGVVFTIAAPVLLYFPETRAASWGVLAAGPGLILVGMYILKRR